MNIVKSVKKLGNKVKKGYDKTNINPFKIPENINVTVKVDLSGSYKQLFKDIKGLSDKDVQEISKVLQSKAKIIEKMFKWVSYSI